VKYPHWFCFSVTALLTALAVLLVREMRPDTPAVKSSDSLLLKGVVIVKDQAVVCVSVIPHVIGLWQYGFPRKMHSLPYLNLT
jgi:hypothetical protein